MFGIYLRLLSRDNRPCAPYNRAVVFFLEIKVASSEMPHAWQ